MPNLKLSGVQVLFRDARQQPVPVVREVSFETQPGKTLGIVGESGSGKSMTALSILGLVPFPGKVKGSIKYHDKELIGLPDEKYEKIRGAGISIVFQDPATALNPVFTIEKQLVETILAHRQIETREAKKQALDSLMGVDIPSPEKRIKDYPHQFSGGMKQRILIAMALSCDPDILILDEPTTALDVTVQAQILDMVERIQNFNKMTIILISHDLGIISEISDEVAIMYAGRIVEHGTIKDILDNAQHPYTRGLLDSIPKLGVHKAKLNAIGGFPPNPSELPSGCPFHPRCPRKIEKCVQQDPPYTMNKLKFACWNPGPTNG
ncbi:ABC transporter ATP-binding protein [bacterium]|nr:ABC transporter ATP-binding protein [bacterium]